MAAVGSKLFLFGVERADADNVLLGDDIRRQAVDPLLLAAHSFSCIEPVCCGSLVFGLPLISCVSARCLADRQMSGPDAGAAFRRT